MNKDTIYIEPSDDITDIIAKIKDSKQKVVALVPPKKLGVLSSAINIKLIAKLAKTSNKAIVIVTDNPSLMKLCANVELPVAETLQSRPAVPTADDISAAEGSKEKMTIAEEAEQAEADEAKEELAKEFTSEPESAAEIFDEEIKVHNPELDSAEIEDELAADAAKDIKSEDEAIELSDKDTDKADGDQDSTEDASADEKSLPNFKKIRTWIIIAAVGLVAIVVLCVWAFVIAPAANITVTISTSSDRFSENATFTTNQAEEDAKAGKFYLDTLEYTEKLSAELKATADKNVGEKAKGELSVGYGFKSSDFDDDTGKASITVAAGTIFSQNGKQYATDKNLALSTDLSKCEWAGEPKRCNVSAKVAVTAVEAGEDYNVTAGATWSNGVYYATNAEPISGGSNKIVKVVQQSDIDAAVSELKKLSDTEAKEILSEKLNEGHILIDSSYKAVASEPVTTVKVGEEISEGAKVEQEITYTIYAVSSANIEEFIRAKANLSTDQKIYELGDPYIERFTIDGDNMTGKIKTNYKYGPEITEESILEKVKGKSKKSANSILRSIVGIKDVSIDTSFFWVDSIPDDASKVHITLEVQQ